MDVYLRLSWTDVRLVSNESKPRHINQLEQLNKIWVPDIYFGNARKADFQTVTVPNFGAVIYKDGIVALSRRYL